MEDKHFGAKRVENWKAGGVVILLK